MKKIKFITLSTLLVTSVVLGATSSHAAEGDKTLKSNGHVNFIDNNDTEGPVDPIDPEKPVEPIDPTNPGETPEPGTGGPLSLDFASSLKFGTHKISTKDESYAVNAQMVKTIGEDGKPTGEIAPKPVYAQVTDKRGKDELLGWKLQVKQNGQFKASATDVLTGAEIRFTAGQTETTANNGKPGNNDVKPVETVTLDPEGKASSDLLVAAKGNGAGTWIYRLGDDSSLTTEKEEVEGEEEDETIDVAKDSAVTLFVPGTTTKSKKAAYETTLTWTVSTTPGQGEGGEGGE